MQPNGLIPKTLAWVIVFSQTLWIMPFTIEWPIYRIGVVIAACFFLYIVRKNLLTYNDIVLLVALLFIPAIWFGLEAAIAGNIQIFKTAIVYSLFIISGFTLYKCCSLAYLCGILRVFVLINLILIPIWSINGKAEVYTPADSRLDSMRVLNWCGIDQKIVVYKDGIQRFGGFTRNPNILACLAFIGSIGFFVNKTRRSEKILWTIALIMLLWATQSRGTLVLLGIFVIVLTFAAIEKKAHRMLFISTIMGLDSIIFTIMSHLRVGSDISSGRLNQGRLAFSSLDIHSIWLGFGYNQSYEKLSKVLHVSYGIDNTYLTMLIEHGIIGSIVLFSCLAFAILYAYHCQKAASKKKKAVYIAFFLAWLVYSGFETAFFKNIFNQTFVTFLILTYTSDENGICKTG
ncbi:Hypothetical protein LUCI_0560 [Lucifera butyrica]|uniref:Uncharacterized protein n=1 Tax=Lucifera butyrica TaxID=1351585 RepID=A0A498R1U9_9FIRM|nr:hypothetical protein [Lucifera butyrica]VBB05351.1 Hypothetical protein LUCI_0560 [Lucifera butyrica]